eukprot:6189256-Pleurochrysis_carterae.AAC.1
MRSHVDLSQANRVLQRCLEGQQTWYQDDAERTIALEAKLLPKFCSPWSEGGFCCGDYGYIYHDDVHSVQASKGVEDEVGRPMLFCYYMLSDWPLRLTLLD